MTEYQGLKTADIIVDELINWGVQVIFGLPGDGINGVIEALRRRQKEIRFVLVRHEESAAFMACAYAKYTGKLGACIATSGPGAIHLLTGLYDAKADNTPVLAITGSTYSDMMGSRYQQDVNLLQLFSDVAVYNNMITGAAHAETAMNIACRSALSLRSVSHLTIPIDIQEQKLKDQYTRHNVPGHTAHVLYSRARRLPEQQLIEKAAKILNAGNKIVLLVGQGALDAGDEVRQVAEKLAAPVVKALLGKAVIPDDDSYSIGGLGLLGTEPASDAMAEADTLLMVGTSFPYIDYLPKPGQAKGIQIDLFPDRIGLRYPVEVGLVGDSKLTLAALLPLLNKKNQDIFLKSKQHAMEKWKKLMHAPDPSAKPIKPQVIAAAVSDELQDDAIVSADSGTNTIWAARYINIRKGMKFSLSGTLASMACGLPYAIAAQIAFPERQSVAFVGDGGLAMLMGEFATAVKYNLPIKVIVIKNNVLGMIRWEQMAFLGNPEYGIEFTPIDFAKFAEACGGKGYSISEPSEVKSIMHEGMSQEKPTIIEAYVDPFEPPMPPKAGLDFVKNVAESFAKGEPYAKRIGLTIFRNQVHEVLRKLHAADKDQENDF